MSAIRETLAATGQTGEVVCQDANAIFAVISEDATSFSIQPQIFIVDTWVDYGSPVTAVGQTTLSVHKGLKIRGDLTAVSGQTAGVEVGITG